jgi:outer membrane protein assembly factor BamA
VRVLLPLIAVVALGGWVGIRQLPDGERVAATSSTVRRQEIASIALDGKGLPLASLRDVLTSRAGDLIDLGALARDRSALSDVLVARGYLRARVGDPRVTFGADGAAYVTFPIDQGAQYRIGRVTVAGASADAAGVLSISEGDLADGTHIALARHALEERLRVRAGAASVTVDATLSIDDARRIADVQLVAAHR